MKRPRIHVRLRWEDQHGELERRLEVSDGCPSCSSRRYRRADTAGDCTDPRYMPVECVRCTSSYWARPRAVPASSSAEVETAPPMPLRERVKRAWCWLWAGLGAP